MMLLEQIVASVSEAQQYIQDDGRISGPSDRAEIADRMQAHRFVSRAAE